MKNRTLYIIIGLCIVINAYIALAMRDSHVQTHQSAKKPISSSALLT